MAEYENDTFVEEEGSGPEGLPMAAQIHVVIGIQAVVLLVGGFGNTAVLYLYGQRGERLSFITGILALAGKDLVCCVVYMPVCIIIEAYSFSTTSDLLCKLYHYLGNVNHSFSVFFLVLLGFDRFACVVKGYIQSTYRRRVLIAVAGVTVISFSMNIVPSLAFGVYGKAQTNHTAASNTSDEPAKIVMKGMCHFNGLLVSIKSLLTFFNVVIYSQLLVSPLIIAITYSSILGVYLYRKRFATAAGNAASPLDGVGRPSGRGTTAASMDELDASPRGETGDVEEDSRLVRLQQDQLKVTVWFFCVTMGFYIVLLAPYLMTFNAIPSNFLLMSLHHFLHVFNPFIYVCLDSVFRMEIKTLFTSTWSRIVN